jgi:preprotein translocase subunit YajC
MYSIIAQAQGGTWWMQPQIFLMIAIVGVFYFFMIRPQQNKIKDQKKFIEELKKGDDVVTIGGLYGRIAEMEGDTIILEVERGGRIKCSKSAVSMETTKAAQAKK